VIPYAITTAASRISWADLAPRKRATTCIKPNYYKDYPGYQNVSDDSDVQGHCHLASDSNEIFTPVEVEELENAAVEAVDERFVLLMLEDIEAAKDIALEEENKAVEYINFELPEDLITQLELSTVTRILLMKTGKFWKFCWKFHLQRSIQH
jgi:hypothetical protein